MSDTSRCYIKTAKQIIRQTTPTDSGFLKPNVFVKFQWSYPKGTPNTCAVYRKNRTICEFREITLTLYVTLPVLLIARLTGGDYLVDFEEANVDVGLTQLFSIFGVPAEVDRQV